MQGVGASKSLIVQEISGNREHTLSLAVAISFPSDFAKTLQILHRTDILIQPKQAKGQNDTKFWESSEFGKGGPNSGR